MCRFYTFKSIVQFELSVRVLKTVQFQFFKSCVCHTSFQPHYSISSIQIRRHPNTYYGTSKCYFIWLARLSSCMDQLSNFCNPENPPFNKAEGNKLIILFSYHHHPILTFYTCVYGLLHNVVKTHYKMWIINEYVKNINKDNELLCWEEVRGYLVIGPFFFDYFTFFFYSLVDPVTNVFLDFEGREEDWQESVMYVEFRFMRREISRFVGCGI